MHRNFTSNEANLYFSSLPTVVHKVTWRKVRKVYGIDEGQTSFGEAKDKRADGKKVKA